MLDGVSNMDNYTGLTAPFPNSDATQEFKVISNNFSAHLRLFSRRGGQHRHQVRHQPVSRRRLLVCAQQRSERLRLVQPGDVDPLKRNQFGVFAGGPIKKDKLFFFGNYQGTRQVTASTNLTTNTPTAAMLTATSAAWPRHAGSHQPERPVPYRQWHRQSVGYQRRYAERRSRDHH